MVNPQTNDGETMLNPQCCRLTPKFSPFPRKFNYCAIFLVVNSQKLPKNLHFMIHLIPLLLLPRLPPILLPSLPHRRRPPPPVSAPPRAARPLADPPSRPCDPRRSRRRRRHRCCWGGECRPSYPGNCGFWAWKMLETMGILGANRGISPRNLGIYFANFLGCKQRPWGFSYKKLSFHQWQCGFYHQKLGLHHDWYNNNRDSTINRGRFKEPNKDVTIDMPMLFGWDLELVVGGFINTGTTRNTVKTASRTRRWINLATVQISYYLRLLEHGWHVAVRDSYYPITGSPGFFHRDPIHQFGLKPQCRLMVHIYIYSGQDVRACYQGGSGYSIVYFRTVVMTATQILINGKFTNTIFQGYIALFENRLFKIQEFISGFPIN